MNESLMPDIISVSRVLEPLPDTIENRFGSKKRNYLVSGSSEFDRNYTHRDFALFSAGTDEVCLSETLIYDKVKDRAFWDRGLATRNLKYERRKE